MKWSQQGTLRRLLPRVLTGALVAGPVALIALWLAFQHKPGWYRPTTLDEAGIQRARGTAVETADRVSDQMVEGQPFDVVLDERAVNEWLAVLPHIWPEARDVLPRELSDPAVSFDDGRVRVGAYYAAGAWRAIVSVVLALGVSKDGTVIEVELSGAQAGSLPVPRMILRRVWDRFQTGAPMSNVDFQMSIEPQLFDTRHSSLDISLEELFYGVRIRNRFIWFNGQRPFRIESFNINAGELRLRIRPLTGKSKSQRSKVGDLTFDLGPSTF